MRLRSSFWIGVGRKVSETPEVVVERVRHAMLFALDEHVGENKWGLERQLLVARDIEGLWYLRPEFMNAIASSQGEAVARECVAQITALFKGHHPGVRPSRFGPL